MSSNNSSSAVQAVIFDWAGTMVDFGSNAPVLAMQEVFAKAGVAVDEAAIRAGMGRAKREHVELILREPRIVVAWRVRHERDWTVADVDALMAALEPAMGAAGARRAELVPGAAEAVACLRDKGIRIGSTTGYTRAMMAPITARAAAQGYVPSCIVSADDAPRGRPFPFLLWRAMVALNVYPPAACVGVDDAPVGIEAARAAGVWAVGVAATGTEMGLTLEAYEALEAGARAERLDRAANAYMRAGADYVLLSVAQVPALCGAISARLRMGERPGTSPTRLFV